MTNAPNFFSSTKVHELTGVIDHLIEENSDPGNRLSLYIPAVDPTAPSSQFSNTRKTVREAIGHIESSRKILSAVDELMQNENGQLLPCHGTAVFVDQEQTRVYQFDTDFHAKVDYSEYWYLTPLLEAAANVDAYVLLQLSQNRVKLFRGSQLGIRDITPDGLVSSFENSSIAAATADGDDTESTPPTAPDKLALEKWFREVDAAVLTATAEIEGPLILAGVDFYLPIYQQITQHSDFSGKILAGNHEHTQPDELHTRALEELHREFNESRKRQLLRFRDLDHQGKLETDPDKALTAAFHGRVKSIILPSDENRRGHFDPESGTVESTAETDPGGRDLYQLTAEYTLKTGGEVFYLSRSKMPFGHALGAELRY